MNVFLSPNPLDTLTDNVGESRLRGFELEITANPTPEWQLYGNVGYTDTEFTDAPDVIGTGDLTGNEFQEAPTWTAGAGARYTHETGLFANARFRYTGNSFAQPDNNATGINDRFTTVDVIVGYEQEDYKIEVFATNLFNEDFLTFNPNDPNFGAVAVAGNPRVVGARIIAGF